MRLETRLIASRILNEPVGSVSFPLEIHVGIVLLGESLTAGEGRLRDVLACGATCPIDVSRRGVKSWYLKTSIRRVSRRVGVHPPLSRSGVDDDPLADCGVRRVCDCLEVAAGVAAIAPVRNFYS